MNSKQKIANDLFRFNKNNLFYEYKKSFIKKKIFRLIFSKKQRQKIDHSLYLQENLHTAYAWRELINLYFAKKLPTYQINPKINLDSTKIIWQYWGQGVKHAPPIIQKCFSSVDQYKKDYKIIRLDDESLKEYIDFPDFIWEKYKTRNFQPVFFSDLVRLALLYAYGGIWIDASILLTAPIPEEYLTEDLFLFQRSAHAVDKEKWINYNSTYFNWHSCHKANMLSSFIISQKNHFFIKNLLNLMLNYWKTQDDIHFYLFFQVLFNELLQYQDIAPIQLKIVDDTLPHILQYQFNSTFSQKEFETIKNKISIHKLTHKIPESPSKNSFLEFILKKYEP